MPTAANVIESSRGGSPQAPIVSQSASSGSCSMSCERRWATAAPCTMIHATAAKISAAPRPEPEPDGHAAAREPRTWRAAEIRPEITAPPTRKRGSPPPPPPKSGVSRVIAMRARASSRRSGWSKSHCASRRAYSRRIELATVRAYERTMMCVTCSTPSRASGRSGPSRRGTRGRAPAVAVEDLERLDDEVVGVLEVAGVGQDLPVRELLRRLALARGGGRQPGEHALGVGLRAAGQEAEAVELRGEVVEQQPGARPIGLGRGRRRRRQRAGGTCAQLLVGPS